jgi:hypothetical protein
MLVRELASDFQASLTATFLKIVTVDLFPIVIVCHDKTRRRWFRRAIAEGAILYWTPT